MPGFILAVQAVQSQSSHLLMLDDQDSLLHLGRVEDVVDELQKALPRQLDGGDRLDGLRGRSFHTCVNPMVHKLQRERPESNDRGQLLSP